jgi:hypothetical protein
MILDFWRFGGLGGKKRGEGGVGKGREGKG